MSPLAEVIASAFDRHAARERELAQSCRAAAKTGLAERHEIRAQAWAEAAFQARTIAMMRESD